MAVVQRRPLHRLLRAAREEAERDRRVRRPGGRRPDRVLVQPRRLRVDADRVHVAEPSLARPHRHRRVPLGELDRVEALRDRVLQVLRRLVLAEADEALVALVAEDGIRDGRLADVPGGGADRLDVRREVGRDEDAARAVVDDPCACLGEELVVRLRAPRHDEEVAGRDPAVDRDGLDARAAAAGLDVRGLALAEVERRRRRRRPPPRGRTRPRGHGRPPSRTTARSAGLIDHRLTRRRTPSGSITPTRSLPGKTSGCSTTPAATTTRSGADLDERVAVGHRDEAVLEEPDRDRGREQLDAGVERTPAGARPRARCPPRSASSEPPTAGPSSTRSTRLPLVAADVAASSPA